MFYSYFYQKKIIDLELKESISKEELNNYPLKGFEGKIVVITTERDANKTFDYLNNQAVLGFDTETRPSFKKHVQYKVSLLQLSTESTAFIFRLNKMGLPKSIAKILENNDITKTGVAIKDDINALQKLNNFKPSGFVELQEKVTDFGIKNFSLKKLSAIVLGFRISKAQQTSNWEAETLSDAQIKYAATDAWVSLKIYNKLLELDND